LVLENAGSSSLNIVTAPEADADEGLIFYDPQAENLAKKELDFQEKQRNKMNLNKDSVGGTVSNMTAVVHGVKTQN
jgi:hypothetical protein